MKMLRFTTIWLTIALVTLSTQTFAQLTADFSANIKADCSPLIVSFTDQSSGNPTSWQWKFGNGNSSSQQNPGAIYVNPGDYTVTLIVSNGSDSDTITKTNYLTVFHDPVADFTVDQTKGCTPFTADFTSQSQPGSAGIQDYSWDFGNGNDNFVPNPSETYTNPGSYDVTHLVIDSNGCKDEKTVSDLIEIADSPEAQFTGQPNTACEPPLTLNLTNQSNGSSLSYNWDFGNGNSSTAESPSENYTSVGSYDVSLTVQDTFGCKDSMTKTDFVTIEELDAGFSVNKFDVCAPGTVQFTDITSPTPDQWTWDFGDGNTSTQQNPSHTYDSTGSYTVTLIAENSTGCSDTLTKQNYITVKSPPNADFTANQTDACSVPFTVQFTDQSANAVDWTWTFGDGDTSSTQNPSHTYTQPGQYTVSLTITNNEGCEDTYMETGYITIVEPEAGFDADKKKGCVSLPVNFTDQSTSNQAITNWTWEFGDGSTSTSQNPSHTYSSEGKYDVSLTIQNAAGCRDTLTETAYIEAGDTPTVDFTANPTTACLMAVYPRMRILHMNTVIRVNLLLPMLS
ncbi:MAG: hypothetical protein BRD50_09275 [Bacteroidetes bacterium SW_11_45_7]|nr:MAG: hypothetical protein BRD50_09275 [Bacteroidetes bacterium SW_11_45_7]